MQDFHTIYNGLKGYANVNKSSRAFGGMGNGSKALYCLLQ